MRLLRLVVPLALAGVLAVSAAGVAQAQGSDGDKQLPIAIANPGVSQEVIDSLPDVVKQSDVHIDASYMPGMPIYYPDGTLVEGQSAEARAAAALCENLIAYGPPGGAWGAASVCGGGVFGSPGWQQGYAWAAIEGTFTSGCVLARGFNSTGTQTWYSNGCGTSGGGLVPWGNVLASPAARALSYAYVAGFTVRWSS
jgi:hypothetical protein